MGKITEMFGTARASVDVCVFTITDNRIVDAMERAHRRNVQVRVISDDDKAMDAGSDIDRLERMGIPVRVDRSEHHMHLKFAIFDKSKLSPVATTGRAPLHFITKKIFSLPPTTTCLRILRGCSINCGATSVDPESASSSTA